MFKWLRDARYADVQAELKQIRAEMSAIEQRCETMISQINSVRGLVNRKLGKSFDFEGESQQPKSEEEIKEILRKQYGIF